MTKNLYFSGFGGLQACLCSLSKVGTPPQFHQFDYQLWPRKLCCPNLINSKSFLRMDFVQLIVSADAILNSIVYLSLNSTISKHEHYYDNDT